MADDDRVAGVLFHDDKGYVDRSSLSKSSVDLCVAMHLLFACAGVTIIRVGKNLNSCGWIAVVISGDIRVNPQS
jgi:hypothetical protein